MQKILLLCWNLLRKGPRDVLSNNYAHSLKDIVDIINKRYPEGSDALIVELVKMISTKI
jgi:hypothetical protein